MQIYRISIYTLSVLSATVLVHNCNMAFSSGPFNILTYITYIQGVFVGHHERLTNGDLRLHAEDHRGWKIAFITSGTGLWITHGGEHPDFFSKTLSARTHIDLPLPGDSFKTNKWLEMKHI